MTRVDAHAFCSFNFIGQSGLKSNKALSTAALTLMFNGPYSPHFIHSGQRVSITLKDLTRIFDGDALYYLVFLNKVSDDEFNKK